MGTSNRAKKLHPPQQKPEPVVHQEQKPSNLPLNTQAILTTPPALLQPGQVLTLQRLVGNRAVTRRLTGGPPPIQCKSTVDPADDSYEQGADQVVNRPEPAGKPSHREAGSPIQRQKGDDNLQLNSLQRQVDRIFEARPDIESRLAANRGSSEPQPLARLARPFRGTIQRAAGLDSSATAVTTGGEGKEGKISGFFHGRSRTTWGQIVQALREFEAMPETPRPPVIAKLTQLRTLITTWLNKKTRKYPRDTAKRDFLMGLLSKVGQKYAQVKGAAQGVPDIVADANAAAGPEQATLHHKIQADLLTARLNAAVGRIAELEQMLKNAPVTINLGYDTLDFLIADPHFKTAWQVGKAELSGIAKAGTYSHTRETVERELGFPPLASFPDQGDIRPISAAINIRNDPRGAAPLYGAAVLNIKESVKRRMTVTFMDSFILKDRVAGTAAKITTAIPLSQLVGTYDNIATVLAYNEKALKYLATLLTQGEDAAKNVKGTYIETQIYGGLSMGDVASLGVDTNLSPADEKRVNTFSQKYGVPIVRRP